MNSFKVKAFKYSKTSFEYWIEDPNGKLHHDKFKIIQGSSCQGCLAESLNNVIENYIKLEEATYYAQAAITAEALGNLNSFISRDFQIPKKS